MLLIIKIGRCELRIKKKKKKKLHAIYSSSTQPRYSKAIPKLNFLRLTESSSRKTFGTEMQTAKDKLKNKDCLPGHSQHTTIVTPNKIQRVKQRFILLRPKFSSEAMFLNTGWFVWFYMTSKQLILNFKTC